MKMCVCFFKTKATIVKSISTNANRIHVRTEPLVRTAPTDTVVAVCPATKAHFAK